ncbi:hypothetical protein JMUB4039_0623 [Leptotrichia trevisanii]|jgi:site-specific recombinase|uniref:recombinase family protein n=1 Tax=Leptotrichia trevisanii TaxID=109328 RepID=UPI001187FAE5|nr:recombinase family protein [Leptotrichia trevisanii]BBM56645.1 hypothetical protein JMUB4039_0623 [Leptotrichia trevisanii]
MASIEGRKKRTHRLIERGAILESFIDRASEKSNEEIKEIIENPVYLGHTASQKANYQFKIGWLSDKPKDDWIMVENTHEPIISEDTYKMANEKLKSRKRPFKTGEESIFSGLVKFLDCGKALNLGRNNSKNKEKLLTCNTYRRYGKNLCIQHRIYFDTLYAIVLENIRKTADFALKDEKAIIKSLEYTPNDVISFDDSYGKEENEQN